MFGHSVNKIGNRVETKGLKDSTHIQGLSPYSSHLEHDINFKPPIIDGREEPLFVLKYSRWRVWFGGGMGVMLLWVCGCSIPVKILSIFMFCLCILGMIRMVFYLKEEYKLYKDKIIKSGYWGEVVVRLEEAYIYRWNDWKPPKILHIFLRQDRWIERQRRDIRIIEDIVNPKDMKRFYSILTEISGREMEFFKHTGVWGKKLIKEDEKQ